MSRKSNRHRNVCCGECDANEFHDYDSGRRPDVRRTWRKSDGLVEYELFHGPVDRRGSVGGSVAVEVGEMSDTPIVNPEIRINLSRGLRSLIDQTANRLSAALPGSSVPCRAAADILKQAVQENPSIPDQDITAVELARRAGILTRNGSPLKQKMRRRRT
jgi:hypothetical protein